MKTKEIRDLIDFISQSGLNEVNIETEELKLSVKRDPEVNAKIIETSTPSAPVVQQSAPVAATPAAQPTAPAQSGSWTDRMHCRSNETLQRDRI